MAKGLQRQPLPIDLGAGLDTKTDPFLVDAKHMLQRQNVVQLRQGQCAKRNGFSALASPSFTSAKALGTFNNELLAFGDNQLKSYAEHIDSWVTKTTSGVRSADMALVNAYSDNYNQSNPDSCTISNITVLVFESTLGGVFVVVFDEVTGARLTYARLENTNGPGSYGARPKVVNINGTFAILWQNSSGDIRWTKTTPAAPTSFTSVATLQSSRLSAAWDVAGIGGTNGALMSSDGSGNFTVTNLQTSGLTGVSAAFSSTWATAVGCALCYIGTSYLGAVLWQGTSIVAQSLVPANLSVAHAQFTTTAGGTVGNLTLADTGAGTTFGVYYDVPATATYNTLVRGFTFAAGAVTTTADALKLRGAGLATRAFTIDSVVYYGVVYASAQQSQSSVFIIDGTVNQIVARPFPFRATGLVSTLPRVTTVTSTKWQFSLATKNNFVAGPKSVTTYTVGIGRVTLDFTTERFLQAQLNKNLHIGGACVNNYDGTSVTEQGFPIIPEIASAVGGSWEIRIVTDPKAPETNGTAYLIPPPDVSDVTPARPSGAQIEAGSYLVLFGADTAGTADPVDAWLLWFKVDGSGSAPGFTIPSTVPPDTGTPNVRAVEVDLSSTDTQYDVARKIVQAMRQYSLVYSAGFGLGNEVEIDSGWGIAVTLYAPPSYRPTYPTDYSSFSYTIVYEGDNTYPQHSHVRLVFPAGKFITAGQYFLLHSTNHSIGHTNEQELFYFTVDGVGSAPSPLPAGVVSTYVIAIASTDTAQTVGATAVTAINAATDSGSGNNLYVSSGGPIVEVYPKTTYALDSYYSTHNPAPMVKDVGGRMEAGQRQYYATYEWYDTQGNLHRSAPSAPLQVTNGAKDGPTVGGGTIPYYKTAQTNILSITTLRLTRKANARVVLWRTQANGQIAYRISDTPNSTSSDSVSFTDYYSDTDITSAEQLYTSAGGELPNIPPPPSSIVTAWNGRIMLVDSTDPTALWPSKVATDAYGVAFSGDLTKVRVDSSGTPITALEVMDEKLIIFKADRIMVMVGDGPDAAGQNNTFTTPRIITSDVGCVEPRSVVQMSSGVMFQSAKGIYLLTRDLNVKYIGWPVERLVQGATITSATLLREYNQVRFTVAAGDMLVYDYLFDTWTTFTLNSAKDAVVWNAIPVYVLLTSSGAVWKEVTTQGSTVTDAGSAVLIKLQTAWLKPAEVAQGFARAYRLLLFGPYVYPWSLSVFVDYDYKEGAQFTMDQVNYASMPNYVVDDRFQPRFGLPQQLCESIRFTFEEADPGDNPCVPLTLTEAQLEIGVKAGTFKLPGAVTTG